jgi:hypothetical protein
MGDLLKNKEIYYNTEWQIERVSLLGKFKDSSYYKNKCDIYIFSAKKQPELNIRKLRVINLIEMGLRSTKNDILLEYKNKLKQSITEIVYDVNWDTQYEDLLNLYNSNIKVFKLIKKDLLKRKGYAEATVGSLKYRPELKKYLELIHQVELKRRR